jgi:hypothetical protein
MDDPIRLRFALTKEDLFLALRRFHAGQTHNQLSGAILIVLVIGGSLGLMRNGMEPGLFAIILLVSFALLYVYFVGPAFAASKLARDKNLSRENDWSVTHDRIVLHPGQAQSSLSWDVFQGFIETRQAFLLIHSGNKQAFQIIPKRAFGSAAQEQQFRRLLKDRFEKDRKPFVTSKEFVFYFFLFLISAGMFVMYVLGRNR